MIQDDGAGKIFRDTVNQRELYVDSTFHAEAQGHAFVSSTNAYHRNDHIITNPEYPGYLGGCEIDLQFDTYTLSDDHLPVSAAYRTTVSRTVNDGTRRGRLGQGTDTAQRCDERAQCAWPLGTADIPQHGPGHGGGGRAVQSGTEVSGTQGG